MTNGNNKWWEEAKEAIGENPEVTVLFILGVFGTVGGLLIKEFLSAFILFAICTIAFHEIKKAKRNRDEFASIREEFTSTQTQQHEIQKTMFESIREEFESIKVMLERKEQIELVDPKEDSEIWEGFEGEYWAYNVPMRLGTTHFIDLLARRYKNPNFQKAHYFVFTGSEKDREKFQERLNRYKKMLKSIKKKAPEVADKLEIYKVNESIPGYAFFIGKKHGSFYCILYLPPFMEKDMPQYALVIKDREIINRLRSILDRAKGEEIPHEDLAL